MTSIYHLDDPEHWRHRAQEVRTLAEVMRDPKSKRMMLEVADRYDLLAKRAEKHLATSSLGLD